MRSVSYTRHTMFTIRLMFLFTAITYPAIGILFNHWTDAYDPMWHRYAYSGVLLIGMFSVEMFSGLRRYTDVFIGALFVILVGRETGMVYLNNLMPEYILGLFIVVSASGIILHRRYYLLIFLCLFFMLSVILAFLVRSPLLNTYIYVFTTFILCGVSYLLFEIRYRLNIQLQESRSILKKATALIVIFEQNGLVSRVSDSAGMLLGFAGNELIGNGLYKQIANDPESNNMNEFDKKNIEAFIRGDYKFNPLLETGMLTRSNEMKWFQWDISRLNENQALGVASDITSLKQFNEDQSELVRVISHDVKGPLHSLSQFTTYIQTDYQQALGEEGGRLMNMLKERLETVSDLINGILAYSKSGTHDEIVELINLDDFVDNILNLLNVPEHIQIAKYFDEHTLYAKPTQFHQILQNLTGNAIFYLKGQPNALLELYCHLEGGYYHFIVKDNGPGIKIVDQQEIFKLFRSLNGRSTGVGLSIVKKLVTLNKGNVWVESEAGKGTAFHFTLLKYG
ncbi:MAG: PAS domain-containing sensor histidine kinase [Cyclobacteriaceae bacterium]|nr:PAS domain-containing sensor histidine kinase [Cyclobacteriaceae bacterium]